MRSQVRNRASFVGVHDPLLRIRIQLFTLMSIRIHLPKIIGILANPDPQPRQHPSRILREVFFIHHSFFVCRNRSKSKDRAEQGTEKTSLFKVSALWTFFVFYLDVFMLCCKYFLHIFVRLSTGKSTLRGGLNFSKWAKSGYTV
jgi:hypothetical protein